jgi:hypothetical protein
MHSLAGLEREFNSLRLCTIQPFLGDAVLIGVKNFP